MPTDTSSPTETRHDASPALERLLRAVRSERIVSDLCELIAVPSVNPRDEEPRPGFREAEAAAWYRARLSRLGFRVSLLEIAPGRPNLWGTLQGARPGPTLAFVGHLDTVGTADYPDAFSPTVKEGRVFGRGACDMKGALAAFLEVARVLRASEVELRGNLAIVATADEEWRLLGARALSEHGHTADFGIIGEPSELRICPAHKGEHALPVRTFGKAAHASVPERGRNAIADMALVLAAFADLDDALRGRDAHAVCGHGRFSIGTIRGGSMVSTVPDTCEIEVDRRTLPGETGDQVVAEYRERLDALARDHQGLRYEIGEPLIDLPALETPHDSPIVQTTVAAYESVTGSRARVEAFAAGTDGPSFGFPTVIFGPGSLDQAHSSNEYVEIADLEKAARVYFATALRLLAAPHSTRESDTA